MELEPVMFPLPQPTLVSLVLARRCLWLQPLVWRREVHRRE